VGRSQPTIAGGLLLGVGGKVRLQRRGRTIENVTADYAGGAVADDAEICDTDRRAPQFDAPLVDGAAVLTALDQHAAACAAAAQADAERRAAFALDEAIRQERQRAAEAEELPARHRAALTLVAQARGLDVPIPPELEVLGAEPPQIDTPGAELLRRERGSWEPIPALRRAVAQAQQAVVDAEYSASRARWAAEHGSAHLRAALDLGLDVDRTYRDERLALERPGWVWERQRGPARELDARDPSPEAVALLRLARALEPTARLVWTGSGFAAGGVEFLGETIWFDQIVARDGAVTGLPDADADE
jgi:hypothetical protein